MTDDSATPSTPVAAGWHLDAALPGTERYHDGTTWTEHTRPVEDDVVARKSSKKGWIIGGSIAAGVVLVAVIAGVTVSASSGSAVKAASSPQASAADLDLVAVPNLLGLTVADARSEMNKVGLFFKTFLTEPTTRKSSQRRLFRLVRRSQAVQRCSSR